MIKEYKDFRSFNSIINCLPCTVAYREIVLPPLFTIDAETNLNQIKVAWDSYFENIRNLPRIEENESFKEFFCLHRLGYNFEKLRDTIEVLDFTN